MKKIFFKVLKTLGFIIIISILSFVILLFTGVIWRSPAYYAVNTEKDFEVPVMSMEEFSQSEDYQRPYIYHLKKGQGEVYVLGIDHTKDKADHQIDSINKIWNKFKPDVALVEGRLGFLFEGIQDPVEVYGENGGTFALAKKDDVEVFTWEPERQVEVNLMLQKFPAKKVAFFYALRPYLSDFRHGKPANPDAKMQSLIESRTDYDGLRNQISSVAEVDSIWRADFPEEKDWRDSSDQYGWPEGYLSAMAGYSNIVRDIHMCSAVLELMEQGKKVFITMGSSHAFRIERTLRHEVNN